MIRFRCSALAGICLICFNLANAFATAKENSSIIISKVVSGQMSGDNSEREFSTVITLTNNASLTQNWQFGFYMPRKYSQIRNLNKNLLMQICEKNSTNCTGLIYQKTPFLSPDLSIGFTTVLAPKKQFPLLANHTYIISLLHNNQFPIFNYSGLPQNFFINNKDSNTIININTTPKTYTILDYDAKAINKSINAHLQKNWNNSSPLNANDLNIIPYPTAIKMESGNFQLNDRIVIYNFFENDFNAKILQYFLKNNLNINSIIKKNNNDANGIIIKKINLEQINNNPEGYKIIINNNITIVAATPAGIFYAIETLKQLLNQYGNLLPKASIIDYPRFKYRGILLDVSRHFFTMNEIKQFLDIMATHKLNTLHLHLSDDDAFRLFLPNYPKLTTVGAIRGFGEALNGLCLIQGSLDITNYNNVQFPTIDTKHKGYYDTKDIEDMIIYANNRQITIIPEIDIPAHARAIMKALPDALFDPTDASRSPNRNENTLPVCSYNTETPLGRKFTKTINDIVLQIAQLFNNQTTLYQIANEVSIGGDEVNPYAWTDTPNCNNKTWKNLTALQKEHLFLKKLSLAKELSNIKISGWHEFIQHDNGSLEKNNIVDANNTAHVWTWRTSPTGIPDSIALANNNYKVVLDYAEFTYFDLTYTPEKSEPGLAWATHYSDTYAALKSAIAASKTVNSSKLLKPQNILGLEGALWTDVIPDYNHLIYMALPKMAGLAEAAWSDSTITEPNEDGNPNWHSLSNRLGCGQTGFLNYLNKLYDAKYRGYPNGIALEAKNCL